MKLLKNLVSEVEAGQVVIPVMQKHQIRMFRDDRGKYVFSASNGFFTADSPEELLKELADMSEKTPGADADEDEIDEIKDLLFSPLWHALDTSLPGPGRTHKTLFELREQLEAGETISHVPFSYALPTCIKKDSSGYYSQYTPMPYYDVVGWHKSVDALYASNFHSHLPIWHVGESDAFKALEEKFEARQRAEAEAEAALENAAPRTIEVSEREYREILARREQAAQEAINGHPF